MQILMYPNVELTMNFNLYLLDFNSCKLRVLNKCIIDVDVSDSPQDMVWWCWGAVLLGLYTSSMPSCPTELYPQYWCHRKHQVSSSQGMYMYPWYLDPQFPSLVNNVFVVIALHVYFVSLSISAVGSQFYCFLSCIDL